MARRRECAIALTPTKSLAVVWVWLAFGAAICLLTFMALGRGADLRSHQCRWIGVIDDPAMLTRTLLTPTSTPIASARKYLTGLTVVR